MEYRERPRNRRWIKQFLMQNPDKNLAHIANSSGFSEGLKIQARKMIQEKEVN